MKHYVFLTIGLLWAAVSFAQQPGYDADVATFRKGLKKRKIQLVDVRRSEEYNEGHLKGALQANWLEKERFAGWALENLDKKRPVYVYCRSGKRSGQAARWLLENGFDNVINLEGGILSWKEAGLPVVSGDTTTETSK